MGVLLATVAVALWLVALGWSWRYRRARDERTRDILAGGGLVLLTAGFFWRTLTGDVYQPADGGDLVSFLYPTYRFAAATLASGELPLWNPHLYGGAPFIGDIQAGFLYPPNLLLFWLWPDFPYRALQILSIAHIAWAGLGMYVLLRTLRWPLPEDAARPVAGSPLAGAAALFAALAFQFSDPLVIHLGNLNLMAVLSWLPWVLAAYLHGLETGRLAWTAAAGVLFGVSIYAGHAQSTLYLGVALAALTVGWLLSRRPAVWPSWIVWSGGRLLTVAALAALLAAPVLLPSLELTGHTARADFTYQDTTAFSLAPTQLIGLIAPGFFGRGPALHWSLWDRVEMPFLGVAALLLAVGALLLATAALRRRLWPWVGLALLGLLAGFGVYAIVHGWLTLLVPGLAQMRAPARGLVLWSAGVSVLAGVGLDQALRRGTAVLSAPGGDSWRGLLRRGGLALLATLPLSYLALLLTQENETAFLRASVAALALVFAALWWLATWAVVAGQAAGWWRGSVSAALLVAVLYLDLSAAGAYTDVSPDDPTRGFDQAEIVAFLAADPEPFRIDTRTGIDALWQPDTAALYGLDDVGGIVNPLTLAEWHAQWEAIGGRHTRAYDLLNVRYVIVADDTPLPGDKFEPALDAVGGLAVYRNRAALPRAWVVHDSRVATDPANALAQLQAADFDPTTSVTLLDAEMDVATPFGPVDPATPPSRAQVTARSANRLSVETETVGPGFLVLSEVWYPGWRATVNGAPVPVLRVNGSLRAVPVPAGASTVELWYAPRSWRWGLALAGVGLAGVVALVVLDRRLRGQATPGESATGH
jgi:hypothetical protein